LAWAETIGKDGLHGGKGPETAVMGWQTSSTKTHVHPARFETRKAMHAAYPTAYTLQAGGD